MTPAYVPLWCKSNFSFLEGASHPGELVERAHRLGLESLALTDRDGVYGIVRAHVRARELGVHLIHGAQVTVNNERILLLAQDHDGYRNLCRLLTKGRRRCPKGESRVAWEEVYAHASGLLALWGGGGTPAELKEAFADRLYAVIARHRQSGEVAAEAALRAEAACLGIATV
ncbi:MAG: PHP domain-containing protein, partial [Planctomycetota bacterium]